MRAYTSEKNTGGGTSFTRVTYTFTYVLRRLFYNRREWIFMKCRKTIRVNEKTKVFDSTRILQNFLHENMICHQKQLNCFLNF